MKAVPKRPKAEKLSTITNRLDRLVSLIVRQRDPACVTCGSLDNPQAGHYISRVFINVRWDMTNVHRQCSRCNVMHELDSVPYTRFIANKYGDEYPLVLSEMAHRTKVLKRQERLELEHRLKEMLKQGDF
jgi:5-methylcytosine-specific restriction endonuclease McrA